MSQPKALDAVLLAACKKILSKTCSEAVWGDLGIDPLDVRRNKRKVFCFLRLLKKVRIFFVGMFLIKNGINVKFQVERESIEEKCF